MAIDLGQVGRIRALKLFHGNGIFYELEHQSTNSICGLYIYTYLHQKRNSRYLEEYRFIRWGETSSTECPADIILYYKILYRYYVGLLLDIMYYDIILYMIGDIMILDSIYCYNVISTGVVRAA